MALSSFVLPILKGYENIPWSSHFSRRSSDRTTTTFSILSFFSFLTCTSLFSGEFADTIPRVSILTSFFSSFLSRLRNLLGKGQHECKHACKSDCFKESVHTCLRLLGDWVLHSSPSKKPNNSLNSFLVIKLGNLNYADIPYYYLGWAGSLELPICSQRWPIRWSNQPSTIVSLSLFPSEIVYYPTTAS